MLGELQHMQGQSILVKCALTIKTLLNLHKNCDIEESNLT